VTVLVEETVNYANKPKNDIIMERPIRLNFDPVFHRNWIH